MRIISIIAAIQSSKTTIGEIGLCYIIANLPGPTLWLDQTDDDARDQAESRLGPSVGRVENQVAVVDGKAEVHSCREIADIHISFTRIRHTSGERELNL